MNARFKRKLLERSKEKPIDMHNLLNRKQIRGIVNLWVDTKEELAEWCEKGRNTFSCLYPEPRPPVETQSLSEMVEIFRAQLMKLEIEKLCAAKIVERSRGETLKLMLDNGGDGYTLAHNMLTILREQRLNNEGR